MQLMQLNNDLHKSMDIRNSTDGALKTINFQVTSTVAFEKGAFERGNAMTTLFWAIAMANLGEFDFSPPVHFRNG